MKISMQLGVASAAAQIEGGQLKHNWNDWYEQGYIKDGSDPARACDHWRRWKEDIDIMAQMSIKHYRFSIEWARLEPENSYYDGAASVQYREMIAYMIEKGIRPLMTLHHFTHPMWFEAMGGFANPENIPIFLKFVAFAVRTFGDLVSEYITINEPNVFAVQGYFAGEFPPGQKNMLQTLRVMSVMASMHVRAYELIHTMRRQMGYTDTKVGFAHHMRVFTPQNPQNPLHVASAKTMAHLFQGALAQACLLGKFTAPLKKYGHFKAGVYADFHGLNYYTRLQVNGLNYRDNPSGPHNDLGWEIYPQGIAICAARLYEILPVPIYITENGTCDNDDRFRSRYLFDHLRVSAASKLPIERYYHWCFTDNFEWCEGESSRFGLVHIDYDTQERRIKKSGEFYTKIIEYGEITDAMVDEYVRGGNYSTS